MEGCGLAPFRRFCSEYRKTEQLWCSSQRNKLKEPAGNRRPSGSVILFVKISTSVLLPHVVADACTPLIHDQRIRGCVSETYLTDKSGYNCLFRCVDCLRCGRVSEHIDWLPLAPASPGACSAGLKRLFSTSPSFMSASLHRGRLHHQGDRQAPFCRPARGHHRTFGDMRRLVSDEFAQ